MHLQGKWVVRIILIVTFLFFGIVTKFWLSGQKRRFLTKRNQLIEKIEKSGDQSRFKLEGEIAEFNDLVTNHLYLRYLKIPAIDYKLLQKK